MKLTDRREESNKAGSDRLKRVLGTAENYADKDLAEHKKTASHLKPAQVAKIADKEIEVKGAEKKSRLDRKARKKGGRSGDVNIIIAQKPSEGPAPGGMPAGPQQVMAPPPRPPIQMPPQQPVAPPQGMAPGAGAPPPGMGGMPPHKKGGAVKMQDGAGGGLGRLEKIAEYGSKK